MLKVGNLAKLTVFQNGRLVYQDIHEARLCATGPESLKLLVRWTDMNYSRIAQPGQRVRIWNAQLEVTLQPSATKIEIDPAIGMQLMLWQEAFRRPVQHIDAFASVLVEGPVRLGDDVYIAGLRRP